MAFRVTPATKADVPSLCTVINAAYRAEGGVRGWTNEVGLFGNAPRITEAGLRGLMRAPGAMFLKCVDERGAVAGSVHLQRESSRMYLGLLSVSPKLQNQGVGKILLAASEDHARQTGAKAIVMTVISQRHELIEWYERHGFARTGETRPFPKEELTATSPQDLHFVVLEKSLWN